MAKSKKKTEATTLPIVEDMRNIATSLNELKNESGDTKIDDQIDNESLRIYRLADKIQSSHDKAEIKEEKEKVRVAKIQEKIDSLKKQLEK